MIEAIQKLTDIAWDDVVVRNYIRSDVEPMIDYFFEKTRPLPFYGMDPAKRGNEAEWRAQIENRIQSGDFSKTGMVVVEYRGKAIGVHTLTPVLKTHADFHAHYWDAEMRGKKIVPIAWYKACDIFFRRFGFERLYFKPPIDNPMSSRAVKRLPVRQLPDEVLDYPQLFPGIVANVYEITREEFYALK